LKPKRKTLVFINTRGSGFEKVAQLLQVFKNSNDNWVGAVESCGKRTHLTRVMDEEAGLAEDASGEVAAKFRLDQSRITPHGKGERKMVQ
jgi:hypothetical protein